MFRNIFRVGALLLIVLFFVAPLVQCKGESSISATGWQIGSGSGDLMEDGDPAPIVFIMLLVPIALLVVSLMKMTFTALRKFSIVALILDIAFVVILHIQVNSGEMKGALEVTVFNWLILILYIAMVVVAHMGIQKE